MPQLEKGSKKLLFAWAFYDWANSVYSLVITSALFPIFYGALFRMEGIETIHVFGIDMERGPLISYVTSAAFLAIALITPIIAGMADYLGNKKIFMKLFCYLGSLSCVALYWFSLSQIYFSLAAYFFGLVGFWVSYALNNSYLPDIAYKEQQNQISAKGFSLGYVGSVLLLLINLAMVMKPEVFGTTGSDGEAAIKAMRYSFISVGLWWFIFSQYSFYYMPKGHPSSGSLNKLFFGGVSELISVAKQLKNQLMLSRYLRAYFVYNMAVQTIMLVAAFYGEQEIAWGSDQERTTGLIVSMLLIQLVAIAGALVTAKAAAKWGNIRILMVINTLWVLICIDAFFLETPADFYLAAFFVGWVMGSVQALSRATYAKFLPETEDTASYFSFYDSAEKWGIVLGTLIYGAVAQYTGDMRIAIVVLGLFFVWGIVLLFRVKEPQFTPQSF